MAVDTSWKYYCSLTIDRTKVAGDLTDYPVFLTWNGVQSSSDLPSELIDADGGKACLSGGGDIRFTSDISGTNELPFEVYQITTNNNTASATATIFVKLSSVSTSVNTVFYMWWGNTTATGYATTATYGRNNVWTKFKSVWHLGEATGSPVDSCGFSDGTYNGSLPRRVAGKVGYAQSLDGTGDWFDSGNGLSYVPNNTAGYGPVMMSCWVKDTFTSTDTDAGYFMKSDHRFGLAEKWNGDNIGENCIQPDGAGFSDAYCTTDITNTWALLVATYDATNKYRAFTNGTVEATNTAANGIPDWNNETLQGGAKKGTKLMIGLLQELRVAYGTTALPDAWFSTDYNNQNAPNSFLTVGTVTSNGVVTTNNPFFRGVWEGILRGVGVGIV